jgi:hypothetical protein
MTLDERHRAEARDRALVVIAHGAVPMAAAPQEQTGERDRAEPLERRTRLFRIPILAWEALPIRQAEAAPARRALALAEERHQTEHPVSPDQELVLAELGRAAAAWAAPAAALEDRGRVPEWEEQVAVVWAAAQVVEAVAEQEDNGASSAGCCARNI